MSDYFNTHRAGADRGSVAGRVLLGGKVVHIPDVLADVEYTWHAAQQIGGYRTALGAPLLRDGQVGGVIFLYRMAPRPFTPKQIELVTSFAAQAVIAIENTRLLNELRQRTDDLSEALEQKTATSEVLQVISSSPGELGPVFNTILANAIRICGAKFGQMFLMEGTNVRLMAHLGVPDALIKFDNARGAFAPVPGSPLGFLVTAKKVMRAADMQAINAEHPIVKLGGGRSLIAVPLLKDNELIGSINIYRQEVRPFTDKQIELVQNFAAQAVIAIENTRLLNELRQRTDDLTELLEQQTATGEILRLRSARR